MDWQWGRGNYTLLRPESQEDKKFRVTSSRQNLSNGFS